MSSADSMLAKSSMLMPSAWWRRFFLILLSFALVAAVFAGEAAVFVKDDFVGIDDEDAVDAVDDDDFVFGDEFTGVVQADDGRDVEAAAQDGGVAGRAAGIGYEGGNVLLFEQYGIGRREVVRDETVSSNRLPARLISLLWPTRLLWMRRTLGACPVCVRAVVVVDAVELGGELVALLFQCPFGVDFLFAQNVDGFAREGNVGQQHQVQGDERANSVGAFSGIAPRSCSSSLRVALMALSKRATSASSLSGSMSYWGTSVMPRVMRWAWPMAMPLPRLHRVGRCSLFALAEVVVDEVGQRLHGGGFVCAFCFQLNHGAFGGGQHHQTHDAFAVDAVAVFGDPDFAWNWEAVWVNLLEARACQAEFVDDFDFLFEHGCPLNVRKVNVFRRP